MRRGDDGLTWLGRKYRAWRWRRTGGRKPSRREMLRLLALMEERRR